jgi:hypothetical protein
MTIVSVVPPPPGDSAVLSTVNHDPSSLLTDTVTGQLPTVRVIAGPLSAFAASHPPFAMTSSFASSSPASAA